MTDREHSRRWERQHSVRRTSPDGTTEVMRTQEREECTDRYIEQPLQDRTRWGLAGTVAIRALSFIAAMWRTTGL